MEKPVTVATEELRGQLIANINNSGLHVALIKPIIDELKQVIDLEYGRVYKKELKQYQNETKEPEGEEN